MDITPSTELEAINEMLGVIGEAPVSTVEDNGLVDAAIAKQILNSTSRVVQSKGWHFNTDVGVEITPAFISKELQLPLNVLRVDTSQEDKHQDLVQRGQRLYDRVKHTYKFDKPIKVDMTVMLTFEELPEPARYYITIRAARIFQARTVGSQILGGFTEVDENLARLSLESLESDIADANILTDSLYPYSILGRS